MIPILRSHRAAGIVLAITTLVIAVQVCGRSNDHVETLGLEAACEALLPGDPPSRVFEVLGLDGYRPGCTSETPCDQADFGPHPGVRYACAGTDCSLYWRVGEAACLVDWTKDEDGIEGAEFLRFPS